MGAASGRVESRSVDNFVTSRSRQLPNRIDGRIAAASVSAKSMPVHAIRVALADGQCMEKQVTEVQRGAMASLAIRSRSRRSHRAMTMVYLRNRQTRHRHGVLLVVVLLGVDGPQVV